MNWVCFKPPLRRECRSGSNWRTASGACQHGSNVDLPGDAQRILKFDAKISDCAVNLGMSGRSCPLKLVQREWEFLGTFWPERECTDAEETIRRRTDCICPETRGSRGDGWPSAGNHPWLSKNSLPNMSYTPKRKRRRSIKILAEAMWFPTLNCENSCQSTGPRKLFRRATFVSYGTEALIAKLRFR